jgi:hypothetical protein
MPASDEDLFVHQQQLMKQRAALARDLKICELALAEVLQKREQSRHRAGRLLAWAGGVGAVGLACTNFFTGDLTTMAVLVSLAAAGLCPALARRASDREESEREKLDNERAALVRKIGDLTSQIDERDQAILMIDRELR